MGWFQVANGQVVEAQHMNTAVRQGVVPFADATARDTAIPSPVEGQTVWLTSLHQQQTYRPAVASWPAGWYPTGGRLPFVEIYGEASQSLTAGVDTRATLDSAAGAQGGMTVDTANSCATGPYGLYLCQARAMVASNATAGGFVFDSGSSAGAITDVAEIPTLANKGVTAAATWFHKLDASFPTIAMWHRSTVARATTYRFLRISYIGQW